MAEVTFPEDDYDRYIIGFTEIQYQAGESLSPVPNDSSRCFSSPAQDYAERFNRGRAKSFQDHSSTLDKQRTKTVNKINTNILDLWFELAERRKMSTPTLSKSFTSVDFYRENSRLSISSGNSDTSSSSMPIIQVQQLPPIKQQSQRSRMNSYCGLPNIDSELEAVGRKMAIKDQKEKRKQDRGLSISRTPKQRQAEMYTTGGHEVVKQSNSVKEPKMVKLVDEYANFEKQKQKAKPKSGNHALHVSGTRNLANCEAEQMEDEQLSKEADVYKEKPNKFKEVAQKLIDIQIGMKENNSQFLENRRKFISKRHFSFCQSSYQERMERERMNNIRRRHLSQTNTGPLDFNKLKRQITISRSKSIVF